MGEERGNRLIQTTIKRLDGRVASVAGEACGNRTWETNMVRRGE